MSFYTHPSQPLTSLYHKPAVDQSSKNKLLLFIPGNPGLIDYYTTYLEIIQKKYPGLEVLNISHAGFQTTDNYISKGENSPFVFYDLNYQINHKVEIIEEFVNEKWAKNGAGTGKIELFFLCHSVGAFISQRVIKRLLELPDISKKISIKFVGLICPTILDIKISSSGKIFTRLFWLLPLIKVVLFWTRFLKWILTPQRIKGIIRYHLSKKKVASRREDSDAVSNMENSIIATYNLVLSQRIIRQALTLAEEEMEEISQHKSINDFFFKTLTNSENRVKIWSFFADNDYWVHDNTRDSILSQYTDLDNKNLNFQLGEKAGITHSFCVDQNKEFALITINALDKFFNNQLD